MRLPAGFRKRLEARLIEDGITYNYEWIAAAMIDEFRKMNREQAKRARAKVRREQAKWDRFRGR